MLVDPKSVKIKSKCQYLFALLVSMHIKAARKMLMKLTSDVYFVPALLIFETIFNDQSVGKV